MKKIMCALLALVLVLSVLPVQGLAAQTEYGYVVGETVVIRQDRKSVSNSVFTLAAGEHVRWIDRVADAPRYTRDFYNWLEANAVEGGALADPTVGTQVSGKDYFHTVTTLTGSDRFAYVNEGHLRERAVKVMNAAQEKAYDYIRMAYHAFKRDHPEVFWLGDVTVCGSAGTYSYSNSNGTVSMTYQIPIYFYLKRSDFDIRIEEYRGSGALELNMAMFDGAAADILSRCPQTNDYEKVRYLNRELTRRNAYNSLVAQGYGDYASKTAWESNTAMVGNVGTQGPVCTAYAKAFKFLCDELDIPCVLVDGYAKSTAQGASGGHMWNYVMVGGSWYAVDVTWNDPYVTTMPDSATSGYENEKWLLLGGSTQVAEGLTFLQSHPVNNEVSGQSWPNGPSLSDSDCPALGVLKMTGGVWKYYIGDTFYPVTCLVEYYNGLYFVSNGCVDFSTTGFLEVDDRYYYVKNGRVPTESSMLVKNGDYWFYVDRGVINYDYVGLVKHSGSWYYVKGGIVQQGMTGLVKHSGAWYYVANGKVASNTTTLVKYNGEWFYVVKGKVASNTTDLVKYNGEWFYVVKGKVASKTTTLVKYNGGWYYIYKGKLAAKTTTLIKHSGSWYYVKNGKVDFNYSGRFLFNGRYYTVRNGKVA